MDAVKQLIDTRKLLFVQLRDAHLYARKAFRAAEDKGLDGTGTLAPEDERDIAELLKVAHKLRETLMRQDVLDGIVNG